ncbi:MAG: M28 family peptidase [Alphaproteobacteria bacterium]|nr:M28 family peptidase [Alphaproteobacteria bacterium]
MLTSTEKSVLGQITIAHSWPLIEEFSTIVREHPDECNRAAESIAARLRKLGVPVTVHEMNLRLSLPGKSGVILDGKEFRAKTPALSRAAPDGIEAELIYVPSRKDSLKLYSVDPRDMFEASFVDAGGPARIKGRIVVTEGLSNPGKLNLFEQWGAAGAIVVNPGVDIHWGSCSTIWGSPDLDNMQRRPRISAAIVNNPDGQPIIAAARAGRRARFYTHLEERWWASKLPEVRIPGTSEPDKFVLLHGHYDSWDTGVSDNATGDACMLEVARALWDNRKHLRRGVRVCWWPGHSSGRYGGSAWYVDRFWLDLDENCVAHTNCDSPGCRDANTYRDIRMHAECADFAVATIRDLTGQVASTRRPNRSSDYSFNNVGVSGFFMGTSMMSLERRKELGYYEISGSGGNISWHTEHDRNMEWADRDVLLRDQKLYALAVMRAANAEILPFDWRASVAPMVETIRGYAAQAKAHFDLSPAVAAAESMAGRVAAFQAAVAAGKVTASAANEAIQGLARVLIPLDFTVEPRTRHDPAYVTPSVPALAAAVNIAHMDTDTVPYAQNSLLRGQNRVIAACRDAERIVDRAMG